MDSEPSLPERPDVLGLGVEALRKKLGAEIDRPYRARQIFDAIYRRGARGFGEMTDLPRILRQRLDERFQIAVPPIVERLPSEDGTVKYLLQLVDGATIETVDIPEERRSTLCISSQAGCALACRFCVTGYWGGGRNLSAGEIVGQVLAIRDRLPYGVPGPNLVFMGMGEPLLNLPGLEGALAILGESLSWRRITVSTAGVVPGVEAMAAWPKRPNLAVSLHAPDDERRDRLMPINRTHPLSELLSALARYPLEGGRKLTIEYLLVRDFNDALEDADALASRLAGLSAKINLIPVNPDPVLGGEMVPPPEARTEAFCSRLRRHGWIATIRRRRGDDVAAACGQLRAPHRDPRGFRGETSIRPPDQRRRQM